jgi:Fe-S-cluster containining protein
MSQWRATGKKARRAAQKQGASGASAGRRDASGRLHLVVHPATHGQALSVSLVGPLFEEPWQNDVATSAANTAVTTLMLGVNREAVIDLARQAMDATTKLAEGFLSSAINGRVACKPGCDHCCHQSVGVTPAEALAIADHVRRSRSEVELERLAERIALSLQRTSGLTAEQRYSPEFPCPFLVSSACTIYEVRPLSCRGMNALDADECRTDLRDPVARAAFVQRGVGGRSFLEPIRAFHAISAGIQIGLSEIYGLDMRPLDLTAALHLLLNGAPSVVEGWLAGETSLEPARGGDCTDKPQAHKISGTR